MTIWPSKFVQPKIGAWNTKQCRAFRYLLNVYLIFCEEMILSFLFYIYIFHQLDIHFKQREPFQVEFTDCHYFFHSSLSLVDVLVIL